MTPITLPQLLQYVRKGFKLNWYGEHGGSHWARVLHHGRYLAKTTGGNVRVVELFAILHDSQRQSEYEDPAHGYRAARFAEGLGLKVLGLSMKELDLLMLACEQHSNGRTDGDITVQCCWDADRLDIGRIGIWPNPAYLGTYAASQGHIRARAMSWSNGVGLAVSGSRERAIAYMISKQKEQSMTFKVGSITRAEAMKLNSQFVKFHENPLTAGDYSNFYDYNLLKRNDLVLAYSHNAQKYIIARVTSIRPNMSGEKTVRAADDNYSFRLDHWAKLN